MATSDMETWPIHKMRYRRLVPSVQMITILSSLKEARRGHFRPLELMDPEII